MASTNKTSGFSLSQFIGTDKPSWMGDYNGDMLKIDTALLDIKATATTAQSGVASAQSAASAAQLTANAAQQTATANAQDITELKDNLAFTNGKVTAITGTLLGGGVVYNNKMVNAKGYMTIQSKPSGTVFGDSTRIPLLSVVGNIFNLGVSTLADNNSKLFVGPATARTTSSSSTTETDFFSIEAYYDGANTVFYISVSTPYLGTIQQINDLWFSSAVFISGTLFTPVIYNIYQ